MKGKQPGLHEVIGASVEKTKPRFTDIDPEKLRRFIQDQPDVSGDVVISQIRGGGDKAGASSGIVLFNVQYNGEKHEYVLRYAPMNNEYRIFVEYGIPEQYQLHRILSNIGIPAPRPVWVDADGSGIGLPGFIMERIEGRVADGSPYTGGIIAEASPEVRWRMLDEIFRVLGKIHAVDWQKHGLADCVKSGEGNTLLERYINWFWKTAEWVRHPQLDRLDRVRKWLFDNQPKYHPDDCSLVHGDPGLGNYMFRGQELIAILDWELAGIVHPTMDIAMQCLLNNFFRSAATPEIAGIIPSDEEWKNQYETVTGNKIVDFEYFRKFVTVASITTTLSMNRNMPDNMKEAHLQMIEPLWAIAESI